MSNNYFSFFSFLYKNIWSFMLLIFVGYFFYHAMFSWDEPDKSEATSDSINKNEVVFVIIKEHHYGSKKGGFDSLIESLQSWEFNKRQNEVYFKSKSLLPSNRPNTKVVVIYDRGFDSFERYSEVLAISSFPYKYHFKDKPLLTIFGVGDNGTVFMDYKGKKIKLNPEDVSPPEWSIESYKWVKTEITNYGIFNKNQFKTFVDNNSNEESENKPINPTNKTQKEIKREIKYINKN